MIVEDGPEGSWYPAGAYELPVRQMAELDDTTASVVHVEIFEG